MNIQCIDAFKTTDGQIFEDKKEAVDHQTELDFTTEYLSHPLYAENPKVPADDLLEWLKENKKLVLSFLNQW